MRFLFTPFILCGLLCFSVKKELMTLLSNPSTPTELLYNEAHKFTRAVIEKKIYVILIQMLQMPIQNG